MGPKGTCALVVGCLLAIELGAKAFGADPFAPRPLNRNQQQVPAGPAALQLDGILITPYAREAVINGRTLAPGATIAGARLVSLSPGVAVVVRHGRRITLRIAPDPRSSNKGNGGAKR